MPGDVIRSLRWPTGPLPEIGIGLDLEQRLGKGASRLIELDNVTPGRVFDSVRRKRLRCLLDLDQSSLKRAEKLKGCAGIPLIRREHECIGLLGALQDATRDSQIGTKPLGPVRREVLQERHRGDPVVADDLGQ